MAAAQVGMAAVPPMGMAASMGMAAMPQPHPSAHYERARGTDVINVTDRSRVGTVFFFNKYIC